MNLHNSTQKPGLADCGEEQGSKALDFTRTLSAIVIASLLTTTGNAQNNLPSESSELLEKLGEYENNVLVESEATIIAARAKAIQLLGPQLEAQTRQGNLEGALAIKNEMDRLQAAIKLEVTRGAAKPETVEAVETVETTTNPVGDDPLEWVLDAKKGEETVVMEEGGALEGINNRYYVFEEKGNDFVKAVFFKDGYAYPHSNEWNLGKHPTKVKVRGRTITFTSTLGQVDVEWEIRFKPDWSEFEIKEPKHNRTRKMIAIPQSEYKEF